MTMPKPVCAVHNMEMDFIPAGISKSGLRTGQPYPAFWRCKLRECAQKVQDAAWQAPQPAQEPRSAPATPAESSSSSPRLQAAIAALQAASYGPGSAAEVMDRAATYYHEFLKPAFLSDVPVPVTPKVVP